MQNVRSYRILDVARALMSSRVFYHLLNSLAQPLYLLYCPTTSLLQHNAGRGQPFHQPRRDDEDTSAAVRTRGTQRQKEQKQWRHVRLHTYRAGTGRRLQINDDGACARHGTLCTGRARICVTHGCRQLTFTQFLVLRR
jgi:hypothetical protein